MAIVPSLKTSGSQGSSPTSFTTASVTLTSGKDYIMIIQTEVASASTKNHPTSSGWTEKTFKANNNDRNNFSITVLHRTGSGTTATITFAYASQTQDFIEWHMVELTGALNSASTVVQSNSSNGNNSAPNTTLSAFADATNNVTLVAAGAYSFSTLSTPTGFTLISNATGDLVLHSSYKVGQNTTPTLSATTTDDWVCIALEIAVASAATFIAKQNPRLIQAINRGSTY